MEENDEKNEKNGMDKNKNTRPKGIIVESVRKYVNYGERAWDRIERKVEKDV